MYEYDTTAGKWSKIITETSENEPSPRYGHTERFHHTAELIFGVPPKLVIIGGCSHTREALGSVYEIDLNDYSVTEWPTLPAPRFGHISYISEESIYIFGGCDFENDFTNGFKISKNECIDIATNPFESGPVFSTIVVLEGGELYIGGVVRNDPISLLSAPSRERFHDNITEELGTDVILLILQFLTPHDLYSIITASKKWSVSYYATSNLIWEPLYPTISKWPKYSVLTDKQVNAILNTNSDTKYKKALDQLHMMWIKYMTEAKANTKKYIRERAVKRDKLQHYGIPNKPYFINSMEIQSQTTKRHLKVVVVGDGAVGKTCLLLRHVIGTYPTEYIPTVFDNYVSQIVVVDQTIDMSYWGKLA
jgi:hypothetical protein